jgi:hypothetical protein
MDVGGSELRRRHPRKEQDMNKGKISVNSLQYQTTTGIHEQQFFDEQAKSVRPGLQTKGSKHPSEEPKAAYRSVMEEQLAGIEGRIDYLSNALDTLEKRLAPVMRDNPSKATEASLPCADSPLGRKLENFNSRMNGLQNHILHIIERLEV